MNFKKVFVVVAILVMVLFIVGCSSDPQATGSQAADSQSGTNGSSSELPADDSATLDQAYGDVLDESDDVIVEDSV